MEAGDNLALCTLYTRHLFGSLHFQAEPCRDLHLRTEPEAVVVAAVGNTDPFHHRGTFALWVVARMHIQLAWVLEFSAELVLRAVPQQPGVQEEGQHGLYEHLAGFGASVPDCWDSLVTSFSLFGPAIWIGYLSDADTAQEGKQIVGRMVLAKASADEKNIGQVDPHRPGVEKHSKETLAGGMGRQAPDKDGDTRQASEDIHRMDHLCTAGIHGEAKGEGGEQADRGGTDSHVPAPQDNRADAPRTLCPCWVDALRGHGLVTAGVCQILPAGMATVLVPA